MDHINLIRKIAWSYHGTTGIDWEELFSVASLAYSESLKTWDTTKGSISTHLWYNVHSRLLDHLKAMKANKKAMLAIEYIDEYDMNLPEISTNFFESLTKDAEELARVVVRCANRFAAMTSDEAESRLYSVMRNRGWSTIKTRRAINDLKEVCNT